MWTRVFQRATPLFNSFCGNVASKLHVIFVACFTEAFSISGIFNQNTNISFKMTIKKIILKPFQLKLKRFVLSTEFFIRLLCCQWFWRRKFCSWDQASFSCGQCSFSLFSSRLFNNQWNVNEKLDVVPSLPEGWYFESRQGHRLLSLLWQWNCLVLFFVQGIFFLRWKRRLAVLKQKLVKY